MKDLLKKLVEFKTVVGNPAAMLAALDFIEDYLTERGMFTQRVQNGEVWSLLARTRADVITPKVVLGAHLDVVPAPNELFHLREDQGKLYGRGTLDMKFAIAAYMQLVDDLRGKLDQYDFGLMITTDEEQGGLDGAGKLAEAGYLPKVLLLPDGGDNWQIQTFSKGFLYFSIETKGRTAHGSKPWLGQNAILNLVDIIHDIQRLFPEASVDTNTLNVGQIEGGNAPNQVAASAKAVLDGRFISEAEKARILTKIEAICAVHEAKITVLVDGPACAIDLQNTYVEPFAKLITEVTGVTITGSRTTGTNDVRFFAAKGVPGISLYPVGGGHHGPEEWIDATAFNQFHEITAAYIEQMAKISAEVLTPVQ